MGLTNKLTAIADAIRTKANLGDDKLTLDAMATKIADIEGASAYDPLAKFDSDAVKSKVAEYKQGTSSTDIYSLNAEIAKATLAFNEGLIDYLIDECGIKLKRGTATNNAITFIANVYSSGNPSVKVDTVRASGNVKNNEIIWSLLCDAKSVKNLFYINFEGGTGGTLSIQSIVKTSPFNYTSIGSDFYKNITAFKINGKDFFERNSVDDLRYTFNSSAGFYKYRRYIVRVLDTIDFTNNPTIEFDLWVKPSE